MFHKTTSLIYIRKLLEIQGSANTSSHLKSENNYTELQTNTEFKILPKIIYSKCPLEQDNLKWLPECSRWRYPLHRKNACNIIIAKQTVLSEGTTNKRLSEERILCMGIIGPWSDGPRWNGWASRQIPPPRSLQNCPVPQPGEQSRSALPWKDLLKGLELTQASPNH